MTNRDNLTPLERRILAMRDEGLSTEEIGRRVRKSPKQVERIISWTEIPRSRRPDHREGSPLSAVERRVLHMRGEGLAYEEIGDRLRRTPRYVRQVEALGHLRKGWHLLAA